MADLDAISIAAAESVRAAVADACWFGDCGCAEPDACILDAYAVAHPYAGPLAVPCADPDCDFIAYH